jgi:glycosyltransferase involved in cell wall biosynthesis
MTLQGIEKQDCEFPWELIVIDNGSDDGAYEGAREFSQVSNLRMRVIRETRRGVSYARNCALEEARGEIIVFLDDDMDCNVRLLDAHLAGFEDPLVHATGGRILPRLPDNTSPWLRNALHEEVGGPTGRYDFGTRIREITPGSGIRMPFSGNLGLRREVVLRAGGFRTDLGWTPEGRRIGSEDTELLHRISKAGGRILYLPDAAVVHRVQADRVTKAYYRTWNIGYGRSSVLMRGRPGPVRTALKVVEQFFRILRYTVFPFSLIFDSRAKRYRKRYQAMGRILELLKVYWEP